MANRVVVLEEATIDPPGGWQLCLQWARYNYEDGSMEEGYRFIHRRPDRSQQAARGQARIPNLDKARELMAIAVAKGWGDRAG